MFKVHAKKTRNDEKFKNNFVYLKPVRLLNLLYADELTPFLHEM